MAEKIIIDPLTRISGFLEIQVMVEHNRVVDASSMGLLYRGFENMLIGRAPLDAIYFTERICGICSAAHSLASALAIEQALGLEVVTNDMILREILHGFEYIQNHLRHFYLMMVPSFVKITGLPLVSEQKYTDFRIPKPQSDIIEGHYIEGIEYSRMAHEAQAVLGGKAPHNHGVFAGGITNQITAYYLEKVKSLTEQMLEFVSGAMRQDTEQIAMFYPDYYEMGMSYPNFMSYGAFDHPEEGVSYVAPGVMVEEIHYPLEPDRITEQVTHSWYAENVAPDEIDLSKTGAYSFIKTPRYNGLPMEVGPLARMLLSGDYTRGNSCMDRIMARTLETEKILHIIKELLRQVKLLPNNQQIYQIPEKAQGMGLVDTTRGALGHYLEIRNKVIGNYTLITPSMWNLSPKDSEGNPGVIERALIGTAIQDQDNPVEIGRIVRSFDPCVSCATHVYDARGNHSLLKLLI